MYIVSGLTVPTFPCLCVCFFVYLWECKQNGLYTHIVAHAQVTWLDEGGHVITGASRTCAGVSSIPATTT
jgi:hypothetical protein